MEKLSTKDKKLLYHLSQNARQSHSQIAKKINLSKSAVGYKIKTLQKKGIIKNFTTTIKTSTLNATSFSMLIKLNTPIEKNPELKTYLTKHPNTLWILTLSGTYDLFIEFITFSFTHMKNLIKEIKQKLSTNLNHYELHLAEETLKVEHLIKDIYKDLDLETLKIKPREYTQKKLDNTDKKILTILAENSSLSLVDIATKIKSKWDIVRYRIKQLEQHQILTAYYPEINYSKLGYLRFLCKIEIVNSSPETSSKIKQKIKNHGNITYAFTNLNTQSILFDIQIKTIQDLDIFLGELQQKFKNQIRKIDYYIVRDQLKFNLFPKGLSSNFPN